MENEAPYKVGDTIIHRTTGRKVEVVAIEPAKWKKGHWAIEATYSEGGSHGYVCGLDLMFEGE